VCILTAWCEFSVCMCEYECMVSEWRVKLWLPRLRGVSFLSFWGHLMRLEIACVEYVDMNVKITDLNVNLIAK
jgi:hypothetical protein